MTGATQSTLIRWCRERTHDHELHLAYGTENNQGHGFDPAELDEYELTPIREPHSTSDVAAYTYTDELGDLWLVLVGTDASGSDESRWAVKIGDVGVWPAPESE